MKVTFEFDFDSPHVVSSPAFGDTTAVMQQEVLRHVRCDALCSTLYDIHKQAMQNNSVTFEYIQNLLEANNIDLEEIWS